MMSGQLPAIDFYELRTGEEIALVAQVTVLGVLETRAHVLTFIIRQQQRHDFTYKR